MANEKSLANFQAPQSAGKKLIDESQRLAAAQPQLAEGYEKFLQNYAAYEKMTAQFGVKAGSFVINAAGVSRTL